MAKEDNPYWCPVCLKKHVVPSMVEWCKRTKTPT